MKRLILLLPLCVFSTVGCFYSTLDEEALDNKAAGFASAEETETEEQADAGPMLPTTSLDTPPIELASGATTRDACVQTTDEITNLLTITCAGCHAPPASMGSFQSILDFPALVSAVSNTLRDPETGEPVRLLIPGDPDGSRVYQRIAGGEMPPRRDATLPQLPRPTLSDLSLMREWIQSCLPQGNTPSPTEDDLEPNN